jgi:hypothetical protein
MNRFLEPRGRESISLGPKRKAALDELQSLLLAAGSSCCPFVPHWKRPSVPGFPRLCGEK